MNVFFYTFGCKVNSFESAAMADLFRKAGYTVVSDDAAADIIVINSCTVTANGDKKVLQYLRRMKRLHPDTVTVLTGCFPQAYPDKAARVEGADIVMGTGNRKEVVPLVEAFLKTKEPAHAILTNAQKQFESLCADAHPGHTRAFMKLEDGCDRFCAYCVIPHARGPVRSMALDEAISQARLYAQNGYKEVVLSGINLSFYGRGTDKNLADAVEAVASVEGIERIRLGSLEPDLLSDEVLQRLAAIPKLCPQFHLALQSGCNATLSRMNRHYTAEEFAAVADKLRSLFDSPTFTTDVIVGFPGETDGDFEESLNFVKNFGFLKVHVFPYSIREGTKAADMPNQVDKAAKTERARRMSEAADACRAQLLQDAVGTTVRVVLERPDETGAFTGYTDRYLPARYVGAGAVGDVVTGQITHVDGDVCIVEG